jgi:hypothetical protein
MVLLSAQDMDLSQIAQVTFASPDRVRDVLHNFSLDGFDACTRATAVAVRRASPWPSAERSPSSPYPDPSTMTYRQQDKRCLTRH